MNKINTFYLCIDMGDIIYSLLYTKILGVENLLVDGGCGCVKFNWSSANFILPLLQYQSYIKSAQLYSCQPYDYNYGEHPNKTPVVVGTDLTRYHASKFNLLNNPEIYENWLTSPVTSDSYFKDKKIVINRTSRYHGNKQFYYDFLKYFNPKHLLFLGLEDEYKQFEKEFEASIDYIPTSSIMELVSIINTIPIFVGNESLICAIAKGLGKTAYVEYCPFAANYIFHRQNINYF
jgi:hypothetical protein